MSQFNQDGRGMRPGTRVLRSVHSGPWAGWSKAAILAAAGLVVSATAASHAATKTWDANPSLAGNQGGDGAWTVGGGGWGSGVWVQGDSAVISNPLAANNTVIPSNITISGAIEAAQVDNSYGGTLRLDAGSSLTTGLLAVGSVTAGAASAFYQTGGAVSLTGSSQLRVGYEKAYGFYQVSGGSLTVGTGSIFVGRPFPGGTFGVGAIHQSGGTVTTSGGMELGNSSTGGSNATYYITGGSYTTNQGFALVNNATNSTAQMTIANATVASTSSVGSVGRVVVGSSTGAGQHSTLNVNGGGVLQVARIMGEGGSPHATSSRYVNFNGGKLRFIGTGNDSIAGELLAGNSATNYLSGVNIYSGGMTVEVVTNNISATLAQPLAAPAGNGISGTTYAVADGGSGYLGAPAVVITGASAAAAVANMVDDGTGRGTYKVASITITSAGINAVAPTYTFLSGGATTAATGGSLAVAPNVSGGLTKTGAGILNIAAANTYTGETKVEQGVLLMRAAGDLSSSSGVHLAAGTTLNTVAKTAGVSLKGLKGAGTVQGFDSTTAGLTATELLSPGDNSAATLTFSTGFLNVGDEAVYEYDIAGTTEAPLSDKVSFSSTNSGKVVFGGDWTLKLGSLGTVDPTGLSFVLFQWSGNNAALDPATLGNWTIDYGSTPWADGTISLNAAGNQVILSGLTLVPEPAMLSLLGLAAGTVLRRRRSAN